MQQDRELLNRYVQERDQEAFAELVRRHGDWVYSSARRQLRDAHLAEDVLQAVFVLLARKAEGLRGHAHVQGWLFQAVRWCVKEAKRQRVRRERREQEVAKMRHEEVGQADWELIAPELDEAVGRLGKGDREAVLLRFYRGMSLAEVGQGLGVSEEAAKKRVQRAVERLRGMLAKRGVMAGVGALSVVMAERVTEAAPVGVVESVVAGTGTGSAGAGGIAKGAMKMMAWAKVKVAAGVVAVLLITAGSVTLAVAQTKPAPASRPGVVLKSVAEANVVHARTTGSPDSVGPQATDAWFVRGRGIAFVEHYPSSTSVHLDDGVNSWRYRVGGKVVGRSSSEKTVERELKRIDSELARVMEGGLVRDPAGDRVIAGVNCSYYKVAKEDEHARISEMWIDGTQRVWALSSSVPHEEHIELFYDEPVPEALFSTAWPKDMQVIDADAYLAERFPLDKALFKKEAAGLAFAVHEYAVDEQGCYYVVCSTRPVSGMEKELGLIKGYMGSVMVRREVPIAGGKLEPMGYIPEEIGELQSVYGWVQVRWYVFVPDPSVPELHGDLRIAAEALAANELEAWRKGKGLSVSEKFVVELEGQTPGSTSAEAFARSVWSEGQRRGPAVDGTLWVAKPNSKGNGVLHPYRPGEVGQEEYLQNVRRRIDHAMNPSGPSPWQKP